METRTFHKEKCQSCIRRYVKLDTYEPITIIVTGKHGFEWNITIQKENKQTTRVFSNRVAALKECNSLLATYNKYGTVRLYI